MLVAEAGKYLQAQGLGVFDEHGSTGDIYCEVLPDKPDDVIMVRSTTGPAPDSRDHDQPDLQVIVRGADMLATQQRAQNVYDTLHGFTNAVFVDGGTWIVLCYSLQSGPAYLDRDENERHEYSLNFRLRVKNENRRHLV
ncbi:MAG: minor capsid protein [Armatimonadota bacterium]|nr:minor capsid protein [bacterium]